MGCPVSRLAQTWPSTFGINENGAVLVFWLQCVREKNGENIQKSDSARSPHRTAKPSRGCLPLAHPRALPAVVVSDRRSPSAMCEFPFEWWGCSPTKPTTQAPQAVVLGLCVGFIPSTLGTPQRPHGRGRTFRRRNQSARHPGLAGHCCRRGEGP